MRRSCKRRWKDDMRRETYRLWCKPRRNYPVRKIIKLSLMEFNMLIRRFRDDRAGSQG